MANMEYLCQGLGEGNIWNLSHSIPMMQVVYQQRWFSRNARVYYE